MRILIIGGSGFLSGSVARLALDAGHAVWTVTRGERPSLPGVKSLRADRKDGDALRSALMGAGVDWDLAVDCIGYHVEDARQDTALLTGRVAHFVFVSTDFVFNPAQRSFPQPEDGAYLEGTAYGARKRQCENVFLEAGTDTLPWTIVRPCHIYGPGSRLGCLPCHGRDPELIDRLRRGEPLKLVGAGHFLQQPVFVDDLARTILSCAGNDPCRGEIFLTPGPEIIESWVYYRIIAELLGVPLEIEEVPVRAYLREHPEHASFLCHRIYRLDKLAQHELALPSTGVAQALEAQVKWLVDRASSPA